MYSGETEVKIWRKAQPPNFLAATFFTAHCLTGSSSSCMETISTMNESKDWNSLVEDRELLECELAEHVDRLYTFSSSLLNHS